MLKILGMSLGCMMILEECFIRTVTMTEKLLQGEGYFIYYRLINFKILLSSNSDCINHTNCLLIK